MTTFMFVVVAWAIYVSSCLVSSGSNIGLLYLLGFYLLLVVVQSQLLPLTLFSFYADESGETYEDGWCCSHWRKG